MPDEYGGDSELRNEPVPVAAIHSRSDDRDQADYHREHENRDHDATDSVVCQARENDPPDDIQRNHQADDGENEAHAENLRAFQQF